MGCGGSKRPASARSWMARDGWLPDIRPVQPDYLRDHTGRLNVVENFDNSRFANESFSSPNHDSNHVLQSIKNLRSGEYFEDPQFPPNQRSLFHSKHTDTQIVWQSPREMVSRPALLVDGLNRCDIMQGALGNCWFLSACAAVCQHENFMSKIIPDRHELYGSDYKGYVRLRFWQYGSWQDVYIDDKLPTKNGSLYYARCTDPNEFWVSLLEKAYAKINGSYEAIEGGQAMDALVDLTGGLAERYELAANTQELYQKLARASVAGALITCSRKGTYNLNDNEVDENGLVAGHAYTITDVKRIKRTNGAECLLRIRNPWGKQGDEWKGAWSDKDHRWTLVDDDTKKYLQFVEKRDGEFWMCFKDFCKEFQEATICTTGPDFDGDGTADVGGVIKTVHGSWKVSISAGGSRNDMESFATNPQYLLTVFEHDTNDPSLLQHERTKPSCSIVISLMQKYRRQQNQKMLQIGFIIYKTENPRERLPLDHFLYNYEVAKSGTYINFREVCTRFELQPGHYVIIPTTYNKDESGEFMLRVFSCKRTKLSPLPIVESLDWSKPHDNDPHGQTIIPPPVTEAPAGQYLTDPHFGLHDNQWRPPATEWATAPNATHPLQASYGY